MYHFAVLHLELLVMYPDLTHWGRVMHICVSKLTIIGSDDGLSPDQCHAIIWTNAGILLIGPSGTNLSEILIKILTFSFEKVHLKVSSAKRRPFFLGLNVLNCGNGGEMSTTMNVWWRSHIRIAGMSALRGQEFARAKGRIFTESLETPHRFQHIFLNEKWNTQS